jgi:hypothetical protein
MSKRITAMTGRGAKQEKGAKEKLHSELIYLEV